MEKAKPTYDLETIKAEFSNVNGLRMTRTARDDAFSLGLTLSSVVGVIQGISRTYFYKSMTSFGDHTIWQDVYRVPYQETTLYVKFTMDEKGHLVISFKEK